MEKDRRHLDALQTDSAPQLRFYNWSGDCATYGYFLQPEEHFDLDQVKQHNLQLARRPTGGGILFHTDDLAFSILIPASHPGYHLNTLENYAYINHKVSAALRALGPFHPHLLPTATPSHPFCMATPTQYDILLDGKKVGGAAQRRTKRGYLHQGSLSLSIPPISLLTTLLKDGAAVAPLMHQNTFPLHPKNTAKKTFVDQLKKLLITSITAN